MLRKKSINKARSHGGYLAPKKESCQMNERRILIEGLGLDGGDD